MVATVAKLPVGEDSVVSLKSLRETNHRGFIKAGLHVRPKHKISAKFKAASLRMSPCAYACRT